MGAMYRLKAYFGMVPADEMGEYVEGDYEPGYAAGSASGRHDERSVRDGADGWDERSDRRWADDERSSYDDEWDRRPARAARADRGGERVVTTVRDHVRASGLAGAAGGGPAVRGALAIDTDTRRDREFSLRAAGARDGSADVGTTGGTARGGATVPEQRDQPAARPASAPARIVTLHPRSYTEARAIGERFRDGVPVIMNLTELDAASAKRLVDFAAGLVFALRGGFDKVTNRVFLLTPANIEVSADDARMLATRSVSSTVGATRVDADRGGFRQD
ncbi:cell division protein SepF [Pseudonocardia sp. CA-107938]|uniref:cell division protein SepF n=1 Tax=Pseudonocardia sp. CA-107938 TaxID=3240021 RepID=UPI003D92EFC7